MRYKYELALAGLIHDIGKLYQKSELSKINDIEVLRQSNEHPVIVNNFINAHKRVFSQVFNIEEIEFIRMCALYHHSHSSFTECNYSNAPKELKAYCLMVNLADNISSSDRSEKGGSWKKENASLEPIFIRLKEKEFKPLASVFKLTRWSDYNFNIIDIGRQHKNTDVNNFVKEFDTEFSKLKATTKEEFFEEANSIIRDYTWCFPCDSTELVRDVSLYQHLSTTSAISSAIYSSVIESVGEDKLTQAEVERKAKELSLLELNFIGIENIIFKDCNINSIDSIDKNYTYFIDYWNNKVNEILNTLNLTSRNKVINSGFNTMLLIPNNKLLNIKSKLKEISEALINDFAGKVHIYSRLVDFLDEGKQHQLFTDDMDQFKNESLYVIQAGRKWITDKMMINTDKIKVDSLNSKEFKEFKSNIIGNKLSFISIKCNNTYNKMQLAFGRYGTISRISTYCSLISVFFNEYIKNCLDAEQCYVITLSKDESIIITETERATELIQDIMDLFTKFTMDSMGLSITNCTLHINDRLSNVYKMLSNRLKRIEKSERSILYNELELDNMEEYNYIKELIFDSGVENGSLRKLMSYSKMYKTYLETNNIDALMFVPVFDKHTKKNFNNMNKELLKLVSDSIKNIICNTSKIDMNLYMLEDVISDVLKEGVS